MDIKYFGHASFLLRGREATVVTDPFDSKMVGLKFPVVEASIVTVSHHHHDHDAVSSVSGSPLVVDIPGEYEKQGVRIFGYESYHDASRGAERGRNTLFRIEIDDVSVLHCGDLGHIPDDDIIEEIDGVDVLLIPVGGFYTISAEEAVKVISKIEPSIVIPMHYNSPKLNQDTFGKLTGVEEFLAKIGHAGVEPTRKLSIKKTDLTEEMRVVVMEISS